MHSLRYWQEKLAYAESKYDAARQHMDEREEIRLGTKQIKKANGGYAKPSTNVRKLVFELIESQVDSTIPQPKVTAKRMEATKQAQRLEHKLRNELDRLPFEMMNDEQERICPTQGGSLFLVEWDSTQHTHTTNGELVVTSLHPKQVIPQPEVYEIQKMDYIFVLMSRSKEYIRRRYNVSVEDEETADEHNIDINVAEIKGNEGKDDQEQVTQVMCYYRNDDGGIGLISWVNDTILEDLEDYQARQVRSCENCGITVSEDDTCPVCGGKTSVRARETETLLEEVPLSSGIFLPAGTEVPYYKPNVYPIVLRKNVSIAGSFLGNSDVDMVADQQIAAAKFGGKVEEKLLKGGSYVTLPKKVRIRRTDEELKVVELDNPADKAMIDVLNIQPNVTNDLNALELNYQWARSTLGITDSFQGKRDSTATSGKAKEFAAAQSAGRLESKRVMKKAAYAELFEVMAKFLIAFADEPRLVRAEDEQGNGLYESFSKYDYLEMDAAGELYYDVDFLFSTDNAASLAANREAMWQETRMNFSSGAFGDPAHPETQLMFWQIMDGLSYPLAGRIKKQLEDKIRQAQEAQKAQMQQQRQMQQMQEAQAAQMQIQQQLGQLNQPINTVQAAIPQGAAGGNIAML